jgi:hypothetical protein
MIRDVPRADEPMLGYGPAPVARTSVTASVELFLEQQALIEREIAELRAILSRRRRDDRAD